MLIYLAYFCLAAYLAVSAIHLAASAKSNDGLRKRSKILLMPTLLAYYLLAEASVYSTQPSALFTIALIAAWLGDTLLTGKGMKWFMAGALFFTLAHVLIATQFILLTDFTHTNAGYGAVIAVLYAAIVTLTVHHMRTYLARKLKVPATAYITLNAVMNCTAFMYCMSAGNLSGVLAYLGAVSFFASDCILSSVRFNSRSMFKTHFVVMLTYVIAMLLITQGMLLV